LARLTTNEWGQLDEAHRGLRSNDKRFVQSLRLPVVDYDEVCVRGEALNSQRKLRLPIERPMRLELAAVQRALGILGLNKPLKDELILLPVKLCTSW
jgi:hypothetical protein